MHTSPVDTTADNGKISKAKLKESLASKFQISPELMELIIALLQKSELVIPLTLDTLLIPSLLQLRQPSKLLANERCNFPRKKAASLHFDDSNINLQGIQYYTQGTEQNQMHHILLHFTGMCYRRIFLFDNMPINFWPKLISYCLLSAEANSFHKIIHDNCCSQIPYKPALSADTALIGGLLCKWSYWKNCIELFLGENILLRINSLDISTTLSKLENMHIYKCKTFGNADLELQTKRESFEVAIPDYEIISRLNRMDDVHYSDVMSVQILSHVLEIIDEALKSWVKGSPDDDIYTNKEMSQIIPCPLCYNDNDTSDTCNIQMPSSSTSGVASSYCIAFSIQYILHRNLKYNAVECEKHGGLQTEYLAPDVVSLPLCILLLAKSLYVLL